MTDLVWIFGVFQRLGRANVEQRGTGIELAIVRYRKQLQQQDLAENTPQAGIVVELLLPTPHRERTSDV